MERDPVNFTSQINFYYWFVRLRWIACAVALLLIIVTVPGFHYLNMSTLAPLLSFVFLLGFSNLVYIYLLKKRILLRFIGEVQTITDLLILTMMLIYSGGIENPLSFIYLFHVFLSGILFDKMKCYGVVALSLILYYIIAIGDLYEILPHYTLYIFPHTSEGNVHIHASHHPLYVWSMIGIQSVILILTSYFITTIMDRLRSEEKRSHDEHQRLEGVLEATSAGLLILNRNLLPIWHNRPVQTWLRYDQEEDSNPIMDWIERIKDELLYVLDSGSTSVIEREQITGSGEKQFFQVTIAPLTDGQRQTDQVVALIQDITEKKILESEVIHSAKMVTLGTIASGVAHEVGNPLASISARLHLLEGNPSPDYLSQSIGLIQQEIGRIERIVRGISQFGRHPRENWELCQINQIITESFEIIKYHKTYKATRVDLDLDETLPGTVVVRDQIKQAFLNLILNALESKTDDQIIQIRSFRSKGYIKVAVKDNGKGVKENEIEKMFQPFFTTKEKGSGLGLFIVNQIIQAHGGQITVESQLEQGTVITISLPIYTTKRFIVR